MKERRKNHIHMTIFALFFALVILGCSSAEPTASEPISEPASIEEVMESESTMDESDSEVAELQAEETLAEKLEEFSEENATEEVSEMVEVSEVEEPTTDETEPLQVQEESQNLSVVPIIVPVTEEQSQTEEPQQTDVPVESDPVVATPSEPTMTYILNTNSMKFHYPSCGSVDSMKESNKAEYTGTRDEVIAMGYSPCGNCHP